MNRPRPKAKRSRALGIALTPKCVKYFERRPFPPGQHGRRRRSESDYSRRLLEKQRLREQYNIREAQMKRAFAEAVRRDGKTGDNLVSLLERRLDAFVLRAGFARTIYQSRQQVVHRHFLVNGRRVDKPSYRLKPGDVVQVAPGSRDKTPFQLAAAGAWAGSGPLPGYLEAKLPELKARLIAEPPRAQVPVVCDEQLVVEFYSR
ncbi:30S ribosomal protein S4 [Stackebrandtia nassauensis]|uniref:Small ribosomal subunit protein uS4 n=1 Tax=Stackebrandtia nassauensis (strain DSM 44728 / CIP 108903 / NRRL B-16338 / NBRC 102104 / LLR-40K-21) TaxID=446470 RepID=D3Q9M9_STANL|nr:30S ribosomal protein S4 [Stackebrandtia nassauensis]ADD44575.1 ribosomal protein S4 [Stackebrandtia nassauensis DSM 44728]